MADGRRIENRFLTIISQRGVRFFFKFWWCHVSSLLFGTDYILSLHFQNR